MDERRGVAAASPAERMRALRARRRGRAEREIRITVPDARRGEVMTRVAEAVARIEAVSDVDAHQPR